MASRIDGIALGAAAAGSVLLYAGIKGKSVPEALQLIIRGQAPSGAAQKYPIQATMPGDTTVTGTTVSGGSAQAILQKTAAKFGWGSGNEWQALQNVEMAEAGFNPNATNGSSGAYGLAQALGHGTAGSACPQTGRNEYGGYGLSDAEAQQANCGDAGAQSLWMCNYIAATYGTPSAAWAHEQANHWY